MKGPSYTLLLIITLSILTLSGCAVIFSRSPSAEELHANSKFSWSSDTTAHFIQRGLVVRRDNRYWMHALLADYGAEMMGEMGL